MALDKKQIALSVVGIVAGLALTYILWARSQQANAATAANAAAQAAATAEEQEQESQQFDGVTEGLSSSGGGGSETIYNQTAPTQTATASGTDDASDISSIVNQILGGAGATLPTIPANSLIPEVQVSDGTSSLSGIDTSAAAILGSAPPSTVTSTTSTGQTYGATTATSAGSDSNPPAFTGGPVKVATGNGGNPVTTSMDGSDITTAYGAPARTSQYAVNN
jgi:type II secretory pathway pseudopilin PulG